MPVVTRSQRALQTQAQASALHLQFTPQQRPKRAAAVKALEKMYDILSYEAEVEVPTQHICEPAADETILPPNLNFKTIMATLHTPSYISTCKAYMAELENSTSRKHAVLPEFLKYLAINPERLVGGLRWRKCVLHKMKEFNSEINAMHTIGGVHITDEYRSHVKALISTVGSIATLAPYLDFDSPSFNLNSRKLAHISELCDV